MRVGEASHPGPLATKHLPCPHCPTWLSHRGTLRKHIQRFHTPPRLAPSLDLCEWNFSDADAVEECERRRRRGLCEWCTFLYAGCNLLEAGNLVTPCCTMFLVCTSRVLPRFFTSPRWTFFFLRLDLCRQMLSPIRFPGRERSFQGKIWCLAIGVLVERSDFLG